MSHDYEIQRQNYTFALLRHVMCDIRVFLVAFTESNTWGSPDKKVVTLDINIFKMHDRYLKTLLYLWNSFFTRHRTGLSPLAVCKTVIKSGSVSSEALPKPQKVTGGFSVRRLARLISMPGDIQWNWLIHLLWANHPQGKHPSAVDTFPRTSAYLERASRRERWQKPGEAWSRHILHCSCLWDCSLYSEGSLLGHETFFF